MKKSVLLFGTIFFGMSLVLSAQDTANIVGTVSDSTGAVIPGAKVTVANPDKAYIRDLVSNSAGAYSASALPIGNFVVTGEAKGFEKLVRSGITLQVGQVQRVDLQLTLGQITEEVTVSGSVVKVQTETAALSGVISGSQISNLALDGRNFVTLAMLVPGAVPDNSLDTAHVGVAGNNNISFNGGRMQYNNWEIDGGNNTDEGSAGTFNTYPNLDTIAEFRISTSNYGAEMGKHSGATIELATKSGTKTFHGDAFEYVRNDKFDANPYDVNRAFIGHPGQNAPKTPLKWNDYGYTLGGPFYIPGIYNNDKSKTFFFWSQDWRKYREGLTVNSGVPSVRMRQGDFSECDKTSPNFNAVAANNCVLPVDPTTGKVFPGDIVPLDPNGAALLNGLVPLPNSGPVGYLVASSSATNWRQEQIRVDQNISDKSQLFVRWTQDAWNTVSIPALWTSSTSDTIKTRFLGPGKSGVIHFSHSFRPNLLNEFVMSYTTDHILLYNVAGSSSPAHSINKPSTWTAKNLFPPNASNPLLPSLSIGGGVPFGFTGDAGNRPWFNSNPIVDFKENIAWTLGNHQLKFGFFLQDYRKNEQFGANTQGFMTFSGGSQNSTGNGLADMFTGRIAQYQEGTLTSNGVPVGGYPKGHWDNRSFEPYIQDDWKVNRKLTLNLGLRYYYFTQLHDTSATIVDAAFLTSQYNPANEQQLDNNGFLTGPGHNFTTFGNGLVQCGTQGVPKGCSFPSHATLGPRFGFAYDPWGTGKTVVRGGYGVYYEMGNGNEANAEGGEGNPPVSLSPSGFNIVGYNNIKPGALGPTSFISIPLHQKWPSVQQYSFGLQHEFRGSNLLTLSYVGSQGRHLATQRNLNQIPVGVSTLTAPGLANQFGCDASGTCADVQKVLIGPGGPSNTFFVPFRGYNGINQKQNTAVSSYHSLQFSLNHTFSHGLTYGVAYTWSHSIDNSTSTYFSSGVDDNFNLSRWKATSDLNRTHVLELSYVYEIPLFKNSAGFVHSALGGWKISGVTSFFTGEPVNFGCGVNGYGTGIGGGVRCNSLGPLKIKKGVYNDPTYGPTPSWFDPSVIGQITLPQLRADNQAGMFGYMGRNPLTGPGRNNSDIALMKDFAAPWFRGEHSTVEFRWETYNTFNHTQFKGVNAGCGSSTPFGAPCSGNTNNQGNGALSGVWAPRVMQLGLKFIF